MEEKSMWEEVGNKCLERAAELLDEKTAPAAVTAETVKLLVETAILIDLLNLQWEQKSQSAAQAFRAQPFLRQSTGN